MASACSSTLSKRKRATCDDGSDAQQPQFAIHKPPKRVRFSEEHDFLKEKKSFYKEDNKKLKEESKSMKAAQERMQERRGGAMALKAAQHQNAIHELEQFMAKQEEGVKEQQARLERKLKYAKEAASDAKERHIIEIASLKEKHDDETKRVEAEHEEKLAKTYSNAITAEKERAATEAELDSKAKAEELADIEAARNTHRQQGTDNERILQNIVVSHRYGAMSVVSGMDGLWTKEQCLAELSRLWAAKGAQLAQLLPHELFLDPDLALEIEFDVMLVARLALVTLKLRDSCSVEEFLHTGWDLAAIVRLNIGLSLYIEGTPLSSLRASVQSVHDLLQEVHMAQLQRQQQLEMAQPTLLPSPFNSRISSEQPSVLENTITIPFGRNTSTAASILTEPVATACQHMVADNIDNDIAQVAVLPVPCQADDLHVNLEFSRMVADMDMTDAPAVQEVAVQATPEDSERVRPDEVMELENCGRSPPRQAASGSRAEPASTSESACRSSQSSRHHRQMHEEIQCRYETQYGACRNNGHDCRFFHQLLPERPASPTPAANPQNWTRSRPSRWGPDLASNLTNLSSGSFVRQPTRATAVSPAPRRPTMSPISPPPPTASPHPPTSPTSTVPDELDYAPAPTEPLEPSKPFYRPSCPSTSPESILLPDRDSPFTRPIPRHSRRSRSSSSTLEPQHPSSKRLGLPTESDLENNNRHATYLSSTFLDSPAGEGDSVIPSVEDGDADEFRL